MAVLAYFITSFFILASALTFRRVASAHEEYKLGVLLPYSYDGKREYPPADRYAAAVTVAVEKVNRDPTLLSGVKLSFVWNNTACNQSKMVEQQHWQIKQGIVGFVGPSCHGRKAAKIAAKHDLAVVSFDCQDFHVSNKNMYPNFARTNPQHNKAALKILDLLKAKGWKQVNLVYQARRKWISFNRFLARQLKKNGVEINNRIKVTNRYFRNVLGVPDIMASLGSQAQATIFVASMDVTREIMYQLQTFFEKNPSTSYSEHGFISVPFDRLGTNSNIRFPFKWFFSSFARSTVERMNRTQRAFKKLLIVTMVPDKEPTEQFKAFEENLKKKSSQGPWYSSAYQGCLYSYRDGSCIFDKSTSMIPFKGVYLYDAIIQFARALHEVREAGQKPTGKNIVNSLKGTHFIGADGRERTFDENADVIYDYTVLALKRDKNDRLNMLPVETDNRTIGNKTTKLPRAFQN